MEKSRLFRCFKTFRRKVRCPKCDRFLNNINKFDRVICVINHEPKDNIPVKFFTSSQAIEDFVRWLRDF